jgi:L-amino acid N-acyltransferase YncA
MLVRVASPEDATAIATIYNQGIVDRVATFETRLRTPAEIELWFDGVHPIVVLEQDDEVVAFASSSLYRDRACYAGIAEFSVYVERDWRGHGAGRLTLEALLQQVEQAGFWKVVSRVFLENAASRRLLHSLGFREVGIYEKHALLDGVWRDVVIVERLMLCNLRSPQMRQEQNGSTHSMSWVQHR